MKRFLATITAAVVLSCGLSVTASASDFDALAEDLSAIGMFQGAYADYVPDQFPTRCEAAVILVQLYGAEDQAIADYAAGTISHPFADVPSEASPYVAWLYTNGLTNGITATTFGADVRCSAEQYVVFLLRALGYQDGTDFAYEDALTFAQEKGFYNPITFSGDFLWDDLSAVTYQALATDLKDGSTYLLESLIKSGAVDEEAAKPLTQIFLPYRELIAACSDMNSTAMDADLEMKADISLGVNGETVVMPITSAGSVQVILEEGNLQMAYDISSSMDGSTVDTGIWIKDGQIYQSTTVDGETISLKSPLAAQEQLTILEGGISSQGVTSVDGLAMVESITAAASGSSTVYTVVFGEGMNSMLQGVMGLMGEGSGMDMSQLGMELGKITAVYTVTNGRVSNMQMTFSAGMDVDLGDGTMLRAVCDYDIHMKINAVGDDVRITYPDFSNFQEAEIPAGTI